MKNELYYINCLTNLHVGSGDINYNIVDKEVEKDPITSYPIIHASGIKGALRDVYNGDNKNKIFGVPGDDATAVGDCSGAVKFVNANLLYRPMRAKGTVKNKGEIPSIKVTTIAILENFFSLSESFGLNVKRVDFSDVDFNDNAFLVSTGENVSIEDEKTGHLRSDIADALSPLFDGAPFAIAKTFDGYDLPVIARNNLSDKKNLWYEEYVPYGSRFYFIVMKPSDLCYELPSQVRIGGNSSVGYGYCELKKG